MKQFKSLFLALGVFLLLCACGNTTQQETAELQDVGSQFLEHFYTSDENGRYSSFVDSDKGTEATEAYYEALSPLCTEECYATLAQNRQPYSCDQLAAEAGCSFTPESIVLSDVSEDGTADFTIELTIWKEEEQLGTVEQTGQLGLEGEGSEQQVTSFWVANLADLAAFLEEQ